MFSLSICWAQSFTVLRFQLYKKSQLNVRKVFLFRNFLSLIFENFLQLIQKLNCKIFHNLNFALNISRNKCTERNSNAWKCFIRYTISHSTFFLILFNAFSVAKRCSYKKNCMIKVHWGAVDSNSISFLCIYREELRQKWLTQTYKERVDLK